MSTPVGTAGINCILTRISNLTTAWEEVAPELVLAGMTLQEFKAATAPTLTTRENNRQLRALLLAGVNAKRTADRRSRKVANQIVAAVKADGNLGPDSALYRAMGFIPNSERKSPKQNPK